MPRAGPAVERGASVSPSFAPSPLSNVSIDVTASPATVCPTSWLTCPSGNDSSRVSVRLALPVAGPAVAARNETAIQVLFLLETTLYDGAYDANAGSLYGDACVTYLGAHPCEESNLDHTFAAYSGTIASAVAAAHPGVSVSFGLVDFFSTPTNFDDGDGYSFHVDVGNFTNASGFPAEVNATLTGGTSPVLSTPTMTIPDADFSDNFLTSSSITALYGGLYGAGVNWSVTAHHVLELLGSTAPRDAHYPEDYCAGPTGSYVTSNCTASTCEPSFNFGPFASPNCVGWVIAPSPTAGSIAADARNATGCAVSPGGRCTIDTLDVWDTPTDPYSKGWPATANATAVLNNTVNVLQAGCDLAVATGGSWDGPRYFTCNGTAGGLDYRNYTTSGPDPGIIAAIANLSFGPPLAPVGAYVASPSFRLVLAPGVQLASDPAFLVDCAAASAPPNGSCEQVPTLSNDSGTMVLFWNWSTLPFYDVLLPGDVWTVTLTLAPTTAASGTMPIFRCDDPACAAAGAGPIAGVASEVGGLSLLNGSAWEVPVPFASWNVVPYPTLGIALSILRPTGEAPFSVSASASVSGGYLPSAVSVAWGDGGQSVGTGAFAHEYLGSGTFPVLASVSDHLGQAVWAASTVRVFPTLFAEISASATYGVAPFQPTLSAYATGGEGAYSYAWTVAGESSSGEALAPTLGVGTWTIQLVATDSLGYSANTRVIVTVVAPQTSLPVGGTNGSGSGGGSGGHGTAPSSAVTLPPVWVLLGLSAVAAASAIGVWRLRARRPPNRRMARR